MDWLSRQFTTRVIVLMPVAIAINIVLGYTVQQVLKLPIYLDSIGTILVGVLAGPIAGALTGILANLIWQYAPGIGGGTIGPFAIVAGIVSAPISAYVFGGVTGSGTDVIVAALRQGGADVLKASLGQGLFSDPIDKTITSFVVFIVLSSLSRRVIARYPLGERAVSPAT